MITKSAVKLAPAVVAIPKMVTYWELTVSGSVHTYNVDFDDMHDADAHHAYLRSCYVRAGWQLDAGDDVTWSVMVRDGREVMISVTGR